MLSRSYNIINKEKKIYGLQFHPEVTHTPLGKKIFKNFLYKICQCQPKWNLEFYIKQSIEDIRNKVGKEKVVAGVSGRIDSLVAAILTYKAIGSQLNCIFINNGLLRKGEIEEVQKAFKENFKTDLIYVDALIDF